MALTDRDRAVIGAAYSLGQVSATGLRLLISPALSVDTFGARLLRLTRARYLTRTPVIDGLRHTYLYGAGPKALTPGTPRPWRPSTAQLDHTLAIERALVALLRPGFAAPIEVVGWEGESEIRAWAPPGSPFPDLRLRWRVGDVQGYWYVEVDRATESRGAFRRKLVRYLSVQGAFAALVVTTTSQRAKNIATIAAEMGAPALITTATLIAGEADPRVIDILQKRTWPLSEATAALTKYARP